MSIKFYPKILNFVFPVSVYNGIRLELDGDIRSVASVFGHGQVADQICRFASTDILQNIIPAYPE